MAEACQVQDQSGLPAPTSMAKLISDAIGQTFLVLLRIDAAAAAGHYEVSINFQSRSLAGVRARKIALWPHERTLRITAERYET